jgi:hypothetical protein
MVVRAPAVLMPLRGIIMVGDDQYGFARGLLDYQNELNIYRKELVREFIRLDLFQPYIPLRVLMGDRHA